LLILAVSRPEGSFVSALRRTRWLVSPAVEVRLAAG
jgi:hypothetical protein